MRTLCEYSKASEDVLQARYVAHEIWGWPALVLDTHLSMIIHTDGRPHRLANTEKKKMDPILATIPETAKALGIGRSTAYNLIGKGKLETVMIGRRRLVRVTSIKALAIEGA